MIHATAPMSGFGPGPQVGCIKQDSKGLRFMSWSAEERWSMHRQRGNVESLRPNYERSVGVRVSTRAFGSSLCALTHHPAIESIDKDWHCPPSLKPLAFAYRQGCRLP